MPEQTSIATNYARALADPVRLGIVAALADGPSRLESLANRLDVSTQRLSRHARALVGMGLVRVTDEQPRTYELVREPVWWEQTWSELPIPVRRDSMAAVLTHIHAAASAAVDTGGFDRPDSYLTRTTVRMSEEVWCEMAEQLGDMLRRLDAIDDDPNGKPATVVTMLFSGGHEEAPADTPPAEFGEDEAREATYALVESLDDEMAEFTSPSWDRIAKLAEEVRLVARAAMALDPANQPAPDRE